MQLARLAFSLALASAGNNIAARMAMIAITTSNSISVNALSRRSTAGVLEHDGCFFIILFITGNGGNPPTLEGAIPGCLNVAGVPAASSADPFGLEFIQLPC